MTSDIPLHQLLEFDQSLPDWSNTPFVQTLQVVLEDCAPSDDAQYSVDSLRDVFNLFQYSDDVFLTCGNCGGFLSNPDTYKSCCEKFTKHASLSESHLNYWSLLFADPLKAVTLLPSYTYMLFLQHGGPPIQFRRLIWRRILINQKRLSQTCEVYEELQKRFNEEADKQISKDLKRTFPEISYFKNNDKTTKDLSTILNVYANYDVELGYCQGLLFLVAVLYYQFNEDCQFTLHAMIQIMGSNTELHEIFCSHSMGSRLGEWYVQFLTLVQRADPELAHHLINNINADFLVFLYQWWLSFMSAHTPDTSIVYKVMDFCQLHMNWKRGFFKISLGLLLKNKHLLMSFDDCEIVYRHLLSENKWGASIASNLDTFFGDYLMSFPDEWFVFSDNVAAEAPTKQRPQLNMSLLLNTFKKLQMYTPTRHSNHSNESNDSNASTLSSIFTRNEDNKDTTTDSLYSTDSSASSTSNERNYFDMLRMPMLGGGNKVSQDELDSLKMENVQLKCLLGSLVSLMKESELTPSLKLQVQKYL